MAIAGGATTFETKKTKKQKLTLWMKVPSLHE
jgi:hypothetical protein